METLVQLPNFVRLSNRVWRVLGQNPGKFTLQGTNTYLIGTGTKKILLDTGEGRPEYISLLKQSLRELECSVDQVLLSHWHRDHIGGMKDVDTLGSSSFYKYPSVEHDRDIEVRFTPIQDGQTFKTEGVTLRAVHTPGHTDDHCCFFLEEEEALFTGDCVLGQGTAVFEDLSKYMESLQRMVSLGPKRLYPAHGPVIEDGIAKLQEYIQHRKDREEQVIEVMRSENKKESEHTNWWTPLEIVEIIYRDYPESLWPAATHGIVLHLRKLLKDKIVERIDNGDDYGYWKLAKSFSASL
ncbi:uncharacterized protein VTP21DRAFT_8529 [Calcarisporiella thermophila]|uniref:uncharacterized protein n=1 Tax=Calcarisporiella thermophila TaxID=911321 RepID=UPI003744361E